MTVDYIEAADVRRSPFRVAVTPLPSLNAALRDALGASRSGTPAAWCTAIRANLRQSDRETLIPFATPGPALLPDALLGLADAPGESFKAGIERMIATPLDELLEEIATCSAFAGDLVWREAERDPSRWLRRYVGSLLRAWKGFGPIWKQCQVALDRELERIAVASALDAQLELLDGLLAEGTVSDGGWRVACRLHAPSSDIRRVDFPDTGLVLVPLVAGQRASILDLSGATMRRVAYPVRSTITARVGQPLSAALEGLLGVPRAQILRALQCPTSIGRLAESLRAVPSAATHHVTALEAAGLVRRERVGRRVLVRRTARGEALLELYDEASFPGRATLRGLAS
jgi:DNA-binding MarR family transcriptional regulator